MAAERTAQVLFYFPFIFYSIVIFSHSLSTDSYLPILTIFKFFSSVRSTGLPREHRAPTHIPPRVCAFA